MDEQSGVSDTIYVIPHNAMFRILGRNPPQAACLAANIGAGGKSDCGVSCATRSGKRMVAAL